MQPEHIYIEGPMYSGKTTIARGIIEQLERHGKKVFLVQSDFSTHAVKDLLGLHLVPDIYVWDGIKPTEGLEYRTITTEVIKHGT